MADFADLGKMLALAQQNLEVNLKKALQMAALTAVKHAKATTTFKDRSGTLRNSIQADGPHGSLAEGDLYVTVAAGAPYASYVEEGTPPHEIRPKHRKALRWPVEGGFSFARVVRHPGTKPTYFLAHAMEAGEKQYVEELVPQAVELSFLQAGFSKG